MNRFLYSLLCTDLEGSDHPFASADGIECWWSCICLIVCSLFQI